MLLSLLRTPARIACGVVGAMGELVDVGAEVAAQGAGVAAGSVALTGHLAGRVLAPGARHWQAGQRFHLPLHPDRATGRGVEDVAKKVARGLLEHPDVLVAYWDGGLARLVVQVVENAVTDRVVEAATTLAARHGLTSSGEEAEEVIHPCDITEVRVAAATVVFDAAGLAAAVSGRVLRLRRPPQAATAAVTLLREDPRLRNLVRSRLGATATDLVLAAAHAAVHGVGQAPTELVLDAALRVGQLVEALARTMAFDAHHDQLCVPERTNAAPRAPHRRRAPRVPTDDYAANATTASMLGAAATLLFQRDLDQASRAVVAGSPKAARYGAAAYFAGLGTALACEGVLVRDQERLRLLQVVDTVVLHSSALRGSRRIISEANPSVPEWDRGRLWQAAESALWVPDGRDGSGLRLRPVPDNSSAEIGMMIAACEGGDVGTVLVGHELDPLAEAVFDAARQADLRVVVVNDPALGSYAAMADEVIDQDEPLAEVVAARQAEGRVVLTLARLHTTEGTLHDPDVLAGLLRSDLAVSLADGDSVVVWAADVLCSRGPAGAWRLLLAARSARQVAQHTKTFAQAGAALSGLLMVSGRDRGWSGVLAPIARVSPVNLAAAAALVSGYRGALTVAAAGSPTPRQHVAWHALSPGEAVRRLNGLSSVQLGATARLADRGRRLAAQLSELPAIQPARVALRLADAVRAELHDPLTPVLAVGAAASAILGSTVDAALVVGAMGMNATVGGVQRLRAEHALAALTKGQRQQARRVPRRGGGRRLVDAAQLAPGDVIDLEVGDVVPADARLLELADLEVDESALTGESLPVTKQVGATPKASVADRRCMVFEGTTVVAGQGRAVVVGTGEQTETGRAVSLASRTPPAAGVQARLQELTRTALPMTLIGGATVTGLSLLRGRSVREAIGGGVAVAVAAVPEGLPLVATVAQMAAARRLSRRGVLVRSARTLEALGRVDTVCFDKTGTLTENRLRVVLVADADGCVVSSEESGAAEVLRVAGRACPRNSEDPGKHAHATDEAVLAAAGADGGWTQLDGQPFEASRGYACAVGISGERPPTLVVKGAPEVVLSCCRHTPAAAGETVESLAGEGLRVLAVARRSVRTAEAANAVDKPLEDLEFLGFLGLADTPRPSSASLVAGLRGSGVNPVMLTGDHPRTALAIAVALGWPQDTAVVTGEELAALDREGRAGALRGAGVVARVAPEQKLQVVEALQAAGRVVAMVGDGANDAAAIRAADVGIGLAVRGSAAARNAADLVLTGDDLSVMVEAVTEGRALWSSVADAISILIGGNAGEVGFSVLGTLLSGASPLSTRQLLLVNLLTDMFPAMAVAVTPSDEDTGGDGASDHRPVGTAMLNGPLNRKIRQRGVITALGASTAWLIGSLTPGSARRTSTMALCGVVGAQLTQTLARRQRSPLMLFTSVGSAAVLFGIVQTPVVSHFFGCTPLGPVAWGGVAAAVGVAAAGPVLLPPVEPLAAQIAARLPAVRLAR